MLSRLLAESNVFNAFQPSSVRFSLRDSKVPDKSERRASGARPVASLPTSPSSRSCWGVN